MAFGTRRAASPTHIRTELSCVIIILVMKMQINRLFEIIYALLGKKSITAKELAQQFGVSTRTIYRDVDTLSLAGIPVYTEKGKGGGISLLPDYVLSKSLLNESEQMEILTALQSLAAVKTTDADRVLQKLSSIFNKNATPWLKVDFSDWGYSDNIFNDLKRAIFESKIVCFDYYSTYGEKTSRRVEPAQLLFKSRSWYVIGYCLFKEDERVFKLSRIHNLAVTDEHFQKRELPETAPRSTKDDRPFITVKLKIAPEMTHRVYDDFGTVEPQADGSHIVTATWQEEEWFYGYVLSFGEYAEVLAPDHFKEIIKNKAQKIAELYR